MDLSAFTAYEREFQSVTSQLQPRISSVMQSTNDAEATAEIRRIESDAVIARQRVRKRARGARLGVDFPGSAPRLAAALEGGAHRRAPDPNAAARFSLADC